MARPNVPQRAKRLIDAALECCWDFEVRHSPTGLYLILDSGLSRIEGGWRKSWDISPAGEEKLSYTQIYLTLLGKRSLGLTIDQAEMRIRENTNARKTVA